MATQINQDRVHAADRGDLSNPQQSAGFVVDPILSPVVTNVHPISRDPSPSSDPAMFDQSTRHPNNHYHPEKKLKKKKKIKKFGGVSTTGSTSTNYFTGADSFTKHETEAEQKQKSREEILAHKQRQGLSEQHEDEESGSEYEDEEDEAHPHAEEEIQSKQQNHPERISGLENTKGKGTGHSEMGSNVSTTNKQDNDDNTKRKSSTESGSTPSLLARASETASGLAAKVMNTGVVSSAAGMVTSVLNKVGLKKSEGESTHDNEHEKDKESQDSTMNKEGGNKQTNTQQTSKGQGQTVAAKLGNNTHPL